MNETNNPQASADRWWWRLFLVVAFLIPLPFGLPWYVWVTLIAFPAGLLLLWKWRDWKRERKF